MTKFSRDSAGSTLVQLRVESLLAWRRRPLWVASTVVILLTSLIGILQSAIPALIRTGQAHPLALASLHPALVFADALSSAAVYGSLGIVLMATFVAGSDMGWRCQSWRLALARSRSQLLGVKVVAGVGWCILISVVGAGVSTLVGCVAWMASGRVSAPASAGAMVRTAAVGLCILIWLAAFSALAIHVVGHQWVGGVLLMAWIALIEPVLSFTLMSPEGPNWSDVVLPMNSAKKLLSAAQEGTTHHVFASTCCLIVWLAAVGLAAWARVNRRDITT